MKALDELEAAAVAYAEVYYAPRPEGPGSLLTPEGKAHSEAIRAAEYLVRSKARAYGKAVLRRKGPPR